MSLQEYSGWISLIGGIIGSIIAIGTLITRRLSSQDDKIQKLMEALFEEKRLRAIHETQFSMFWEYWKQEVPKVLTKGHTPDVDAYLAKMREQHGELSREDKERFVEILQETLNTEYDVYNIDKDKGTYLSLLARFRVELKMPEEVERINKQFDQELNDLKKQYDDHKRKRWFPWH